MRAFDILLAVSDTGDLAISFDLAAFIAIPVAGYRSGWTFGTAQGDNHPAREALRAAERG